MTASEFPQKDIDKFKECQTNESTKKIHLRKKKESILVEAINKTTFPSNTVVTRS